MTLLTKEYLRAHAGKMPGVTIGRLDAMPERVIQFGEGNFLRAFVDWQFNELIRQGLFEGRIVVVQPLPDGKIRNLNAQDCLYTLMQRGIERGAGIVRVDVITALSRAINPYASWDEVLGCAHNPDLRFVISNTTEAGIAYVHEPMPVNRCPAGFPAKVTQFLYERFIAFDGAHDRGMIILPCELIDANGEALKECILLHAADWRLGEAFEKWIETSNIFCSTLVDRIVPGYPADEIEAITRRLGYEDRALVAAEVFHQWVIQGNGAESELPFAAAGLNVIWTDDITPYRTLKVRILNGAHTAMAIPAFLAGKDTVRECVEDGVTGAFLQRVLFREILPTLDFPVEKKQAYAASVLERFQNPFLKHQLLSITLNSIPKFRVRVLPSLLEYRRLWGELPQGLVFSLAALIGFYQGERVRNNVQYDVNDDPAILAFFQDRHSIPADDPGLCTEVLKNAGFWGMDLSAVDGLARSVRFHAGQIARRGMAGALGHLAPAD